MFRRAISGLTIATGNGTTKSGLGTHGNAHATHTEPYVTISTMTTSPSASSSVSASRILSTKGVSSYSTASAHTSI